MTPLWVGHVVKGWPSLQKLAFSILTEIPTCRRKWEQEKKRTFWEMFTLCKWSFDYLLPALVVCSVSWPLGSDGKNTGAVWGSSSSRAGVCWASWEFRQRIGEKLPGCKHRGTSLKWDLAVKMSPWTPTVKNHSRSCRCICRSELWLMRVCAVINVNLEGAPGLFSFAITYHGYHTANVSLTYL